jgi:ATP-dependent HslUV protease ATP-binding subunit HslU
MSDLIKILKETDNSLIKQYKALFETENIHLTFNDDAIERIAELTEKINQDVENIGARRLQTMFEKILEEVSFMANVDDLKEVTITSEWVDKSLGNEIVTKDDQKFIL